MNTIKHYYIFEGSKYETRLDCKEAIAKRLKNTKSTTILLSQLVELGVVQHVY